MSTVTTVGEVLLDVKGAEKRFGGVRALVSGSLTVRRGEMHGLIGPNGSGKSTLLSMICGTGRPDAGEVRFAGQPLETGHVRRSQSAGIHLVTQELTVVPGIAVWENVVLGHAPARGGFVARGAARRRAGAAFERLGVDVDVDALTSSLAPVDQRLVMIAHGVAREDARLLVLDEPTAGLPAAESRRIMVAIRGLVDDERAVLVVSHHLDELVEVCDGITALRDGRTVSVLHGDQVSKDALVRLLMSGVDEVADDAGPRGVSADLGEPLVQMESVAAGRLLDLDLEVRRGEIVGVAGLLGAGVDEVLELLVGQRRPDSGTVRVGTAGTSPRTPNQAVKAGVGFLTGDRGRAVVPGLSILEHVRLPPGAKGRFGFTSAKAERAEVETHLRTLEVNATPERLMTTLSGGNQQRALLARWLANDVDVLVVDRPTVGVDIAGRAALLEALREVGGRRGLVISAETEELAALCDRVVCLRKGRVHATLTGSDVTERAIIGAIS